MTYARLLLALTSLLFFVPTLAAAQLPRCTGADAEGASAAFEEGNRLMAQAIEQAGRRRIDRARELAAEALTHFDRQCELGDDSALAERGAALMLMGEALASAQSYDAYLRLHPLSSMDARTRRRVEANLQPGSMIAELEGEAAGALTLFVDDLEFGALPREETLRLPLGDHALEARNDAGEVLASATVSLVEGASASRVTLHLPVIEASEPVTDAEPVLEPEPVVTPIEEPTSTRPDYLPYYLATGIAAGVFLGAGIGLQVAADDRAQTYNRFCLDPTMPYAGCGSVRSEYDGLFGAAIAGYVLAGLATVGLVTVIAIDLTSRPRERLRITLAPSPDGATASIAGRF